MLQVSSYDFEPTFIICFVIKRVLPDQPKPLTRNKHPSLLYFCLYLSYTEHGGIELVSKELNHLAAILHVYAGGLNFMK